VLWDRLVPGGFIDAEEAMIKLRLAVFYLAILTLAGCSQMAADPAKTTAGKPGTAQTQPAATDPAADFGRSSGGGGGAGGGY
jgi:hypothetical protein